MLPCCLFVKFICLHSFCRVRRFCFHLFIKSDKNIELLRRMWREKGQSASTLLRCQRSPTLLAFTHPRNCITNLPGILVFCAKQLAPFRKQFRWRQFRVISFTSMLHFRKNFVFHSHIRCCYRIDSNVNKPRNLPL